MNNFKELRVSNDAIDDPEEIQRRMDEDGYVFIRRLQDPDKLRALRLETMEVCRQGGWLKEGTELNDGIINLDARCTEGDRGYTDVYHEMYKLELFHKSGHWPEVVEMIEKVVGGPVLPHPQKIARIWFAQYTDHTTPIHQDFVHFQGVFDTYTCWAPIGDCPRELGGLAVLPGSHKIDRVMDHHFSLGAGALAINTDELHGEWRTTDYEIGDSLIFHSLTVHQALPNVTEDRLRISLDNRYQSASRPIAEHMLTPHLSGNSPLDWEEVYKNWESDQLKYYWKAMNPEILPRDLKWSEIGFHEALELARNKNRKAILHLERMVERDPTTDDAVTAAEVLTEIRDKVAS